MFSLFTNKIRKTPPRLSAQAEQQLLNDIGTSFGRALQNAPDDLKRDKTFLLKAITQQTPWVLRFASDECRSDKSLVLKAVQLEGYLLEYASQELREDRQVVLQAVQSQGQALKFAHSKYRNDCEIVQAAVNSDGFALQYASVEFQKDRSLALMAVQKTKNGHTALGYVNLEFRKDREIVMAAVTYDYRALQYIASDELRMDKQIVLEAVKQLVLQVYHPTLVSDKSSLWWYMKQSSANQPAVLSLVSEELRNDEELMKDIDVIIEKGIEACRKESDLQFRRTVLERLLVDVSLTKKIGSNVETRAKTSLKQEKKNDVQTIDSLTVGTVDWNDLRNQSVLSTQAKSEMKIVETVTNSTLERILVKLDDEKFGKKNAKITIEGNSFKSLVHNVKTIFSELLLLQHETEIILTYFDTNLCDDIVIYNDHDVKDFMEFFKDSNVEYKNKFIRVSMTTGSKRQLSSSASSTVHSRSEKSQEFEKEGNSDKDHSFEKLRIHSMNSSSAFPNSEFIISSSSKSENNSSVFPNSGYIGSFHADSSQQTSNKSNTTRSVTNQQDELSKIEKYLQSKYEKISYLARGGFGVVYHVIDLKSKKEKALKQLRLDDIENFNSALREALNMSKFSHPNIVQIYDAFAPNVMSSLCIEMELMKGSLLSLFIEKKVKLSEKMLRQVTRQLCEALNWIFTQHNILHRDIKPGNTLVRDYDLSTETIQVALADFGLSKSIDLLTTHGSRPGTLLFMAPELIHSKHSNQEIAPFSVHSDMFALGVTLFQLMTCNTTLALAQFCMEGEDMKKFLKKKLIQVESLKDATTTSYSEEFIDIVARMLMLDPNERITLREVLTE